MSTRPWIPEGAAAASQRPRHASLLSQQLRRIGASRDTPPSFEQWQALLDWVEGSFLGAMPSRTPGGDERSDPGAALFSASPLPIWVFDPTTLRFLGCNDAFVQLVGYSRADLLGMCLVDLEPPRDALTLAEGTVPGPMKAIAAGPSLGIVHLATRDGRVVDLEITAHTSRLDGEPVVLTLGLDVTHSRRLEDELYQAQRSEAIARLAGGVSNDFNNILASILGYGEVERRELGDEHPASAELREIEVAAGAAGELARQLLADGRR